MFENVSTVKTFVVSK